MSNIINNPAITINGVKDLGINIESFHGDMEGGYLAVVDVGDWKDMQILIADYTSEDEEHAKLIVTEAYVYNSGGDLVVIGLSALTEKRIVDAVDAMRDEDQITTMEYPLDLGDNRNYGLQMSAKYGPTLLLTEDDSVI